MTWYYQQIGIHTRVRVFCNGAFCGKLVFRNDEFDGLRLSLTLCVEFKPEDS